MYMTFEYYVYLIVFSNLTIYKILGSNDNYVPGNLVVGLS